MRVGRVVTTSWPVSAVEGGVEGVRGTGGGLGGGNASSVGWYSGDVGVGGAVGICRGGAGGKGVSSSSSVSKGALLGRRGREGEASIGTL